ncbi:hypothetical protein ACFQ9X_33845 [Catenulispora yoronensis]
MTGPRSRAQAESPVGAADPFQRLLDRIREPGEHLIHVPGNDPAVLGPKLDAAVAAAAAAGSRSARLLLPGSGRRGANGGPALAERLARRHGIEVVAPDGAVAVTAQGMLFVRGATRPDGAEDAGSWIRYRDDDAARTGPRFPAPGWQNLVRTAVDGPYGTVLQTPAGLLLRAAGPVAAPPDEWLAVPAHEDAVTLLAGGFGGGPRRRRIGPRCCARCPR